MDFTGENDPLHPLFNAMPAIKRLRSRHSFLHSIVPLNQSPHNRRLDLWSTRLASAPHSVNTSPKESLPPGFREPWPFWLCLNRLRAGVGRCKALMVKWGINTEGRPVCECREEETMSHLLQCPLLPSPCSPADLTTLSPNGIACVQYLMGRV